MRSLEAVQILSGSVHEPPFEIINENGAGRFVLVCEHASHYIPNSLNGLGLDARFSRSHAVWDIGALAVARRMSELLDVPLLASCVSRLVFDCNRSPSSASAVPEKSELIEVPGNRKLSNAARKARIVEVYRPFEAALSSLLDKRVADGHCDALLTVHSFTPVYYGKTRSTQLGILHDKDSRLAEKIVTHAGEHCSLVAERNQPYGPDDEVTHTLSEHGVGRGLLNAMLEIRSDYIDTETSANAIGDELASLLAHALGESLAT